VLFWQIILRDEEALASPAARDVQPLPLGYRLSAAWVYDRNALQAQMLPGCCTLKIFMFGGLRKAFSVPFTC